jgi:hypothetical protein
MPRKSRTVTLEGAAARAFLLSRAGHAPVTEKDAYESIATRIHLEIRAGNMVGAVKLLETMTALGCMKTAGLLVR